ncbi:MAG TPA: glycosyltransferase [Pirellulales bacterium]|nr:glycosyltransferase [Pirellulales bacterium]
MKLAIVHDWLTGMRGGEKCLAALCRRFPDAELFTLLHARGRLAPEIERMRITTSFLQRVPAIERHYRYWLPAMPRAVESLRLPANIDLVVSFSHAVAKGIQPPAGVPHVCYCFTPMRYAWQLRGDYFVDATGKEQTRRHLLATALALPKRMLSSTRDRLLDRIREWDRATCDRVTHYVAISQTIARRISDCYARPSTVIYPPVDTHFYTPAPVRREDFYLCLSALVPYKKTELALAACRRLGRPLVVIGTGPELRRLRSLAGPRTRLLGWQPDEVIRDHLRRCRALLFPGQEDFGIVPVEAQACGAPVIAYARGGATETVVAASHDEPGTGVFFHEQTAESLVDAMRWLEAHPRQFPATLARQQALRFDAERYERELVGLLDNVLREQRGGLRRAA